MTDLLGNMRDITSRARSAFGLGPAGLLFQFILRSLPRTFRRKLKTKLLYVGARTQLRVPVSETVVFAARNDLKNQFRAYLSKENNGNSSRRDSYSLISTILNEERSIGSWLESIAQQTVPPKELIIADGGSTDGTIAAIRTWLDTQRDKITFKVQLLESTGANIARGRNLAIEHASEEIILLTDAGCEIDPSWAERLLEPFARSSEVEVAMGFYQPVAKSDLANAVSYFLVPSLQQVNPTTFLPSARSLALKKVAWEKSGRFPEYLNNAGEDTLFDYYLKTNCRFFTFVPEAVVDWAFPQKITALSRMVYRYARGDAEAGKLFWGHYLFLLHSLSYATGDAFLGVIAFYLSANFESKIFTAAAVLCFLFALGRLLALLHRYRPWAKQRGGLKERFIRLGAVMLVIACQSVGFLRGLFAYSKVQNKRLDQVQGLVVIVSPELPQGRIENEASSLVRGYLSQGYYVSWITTGPIFGEQLLSPFDHPHFEAFSIEGFDLELWREKFQPIIAKRQDCFPILVQNGMEPRNEIITGLTKCGGRMVEDEQARRVGI